MLRSRLSCVIRTFASSRSFCQSSGTTENELPKAIANFGEAFKKLETFIEDKPTNEPEQPFATLLRNSSFVKLGNPEKKIVVGKVYLVVENDVYIDFGGKLPAVCKRPAKSAIDILPGMFVRIRLHDLEICSRFLGATEDLSLLEADATLLGIAHGATKTDL